MSPRELTTIHVTIPVYICVYPRVRVCLYMYTCVYIPCIRIKINSRQFPLAAAFSCYRQLMCMYIYTHIYTYLYTHIYTYIYAYVHTCIYSIVGFPWRLLSLAIFSWCTRIYNHRYTSIYIHVHVHVHMYIH